MAGPEKGLAAGRGAVATGSGSVAAGRVSAPAGSSSMAAGPWIADRGDGSYRNPVIHADYSDPDLIAVGGDFFLVASSFNSMPGLPLLHSRDLVNWRIVNHVIDRLPWEGYELPAHGKGVWAPSLRFHAGWFYVYFASPDEGVYMSRTRDPFGTWSPLVCVKRTIGWIDPCPFWDDDGSAYLVNAFANSRIGFKSVLRLNRMKPDGTEVLAEGRFIFDGQDCHLTMEGPKMYKRNGWYYIFAPAGGVKQGWQTVLRSRQVWGPYEDRIVLHQGNSAVNGPHQGGWVETESGESWFLHFQDREAYGRIAHLQPMHWHFDWPSIGVDVNNDGIGEPVASHAIPVPGAEAVPVAIQASDPFAAGRPGLAWQWQANPRADWLAPQAVDGRLGLMAFPFPPVEQPNLADLPHVLSQKFPAPAFRVETWVELHAAPVGTVAPGGALAPGSRENDSGSREGDSGVSAGLVVLGADFAGLALRARGGTWELVRRDGGIRWDGRAKAIVDRKWSTDTVLAVLDSPRVGLILKVREGAICRFAWRIGDGPEQSAGPDFAAVPGLWVGAKIGLYCLAGGDWPNPARADFGPFRVEALPAEAR